MTTHHTHASAPALAAQHAAGPWHINPRGFIVDSTGAIVTRMECSEDAGNAALVAAAPELLAALETLLAAADSGLIRADHLRLTEARALITSARAAIAKAKGAP